MSRLIIGHVSHDSARIWVRASPRRPVVFLEIESGRDALVLPPRRMEERHFYTGIFEPPGLAPGTDYTCRVRFAHSESAGSDEQDTPEHGEGRFTTPPAPGSEPAAFGFLLLSCNLHSLGIVSSPEPAFRKLTALAGARGASFSIHCGDQIYYDVPRAMRDPDIDEYRDTYLDAWKDDDATARFLTRLPHYMILDDHEIIDNFANDVDLRSGAPNYLQLALATKVYREFQHIHNPQSFGSAPLYYAFDWGHASFFVLDTRSERWATGPSPQMIGRDQMATFKDWLRATRDRQQFVVTSVPFVSRPRNDGDKWAGEAFRPQREEILAEILQAQARRVCFLTGDMHNSHHAVLELDAGQGEPVRVHELMSSPVNQLQKNPRHAYLDDDSRSLDDSFAYASQIPEGEFYTGHSNAMWIAAEPRRVRYEVHRTKREPIEPALAGAFDL